jgi:hypothetical protein
MLDWHPTLPHNGRRHVRLGDLWELGPSEVILPPHLQVCCMRL